MLSGRYGSLSHVIGRYGSLSHVIGRENFLNELVLQLYATGHAAMSVHYLLLKHSSKSKSIYLWILQKPRLVTDCGSSH